MQINEVFYAVKTQKGFSNQAHRSEGYLSMTGHIPNGSRLYSTLHDAVEYAESCLSQDYTVLEFSIKTTAEYQYRYTGWMPPTKHEHHHPEDQQIKI